MDNKLYKRLGRSGTVDVRIADGMHRCRYFELCEKGDWIYYECIRGDGGRILIRYDLKDYQIADEPLKTPVDVKTVHRFKFRPAKEEYYCLVVD